MPSLLRRYPWCLLGACGLLVGLASWCLCPDPAARALREKYERIQLRMTPAEVNHIMGIGPNPWLRSSIDFRRRCAAIEPKTADWHDIFYGNGAVWDRDDGDDSMMLYIGYNDGKVTQKCILVRQTDFEIKLREWLSWFGL